MHCDCCCENASNARTQRFSVVFETAAVRVIANIDESQSLSPYIVRARLHEFGHYCLILRAACQACGVQRSQTVVNPLERIPESTSP